MENTFHMLLYRAMHAQRSYLRPCLRELGLGTGQPKLLRFLSSHGPCRPKEIADYFEIDPAAVSRKLYCEKEEEKMLQGFSEEEIALFSDFLKRAYQNLRAAEQEEPLCKT